MRRLVTIACCLVAAAALAAPAKLAIVVVSPGSPGSTDEAKPGMDAFAAAASSRCGLALTAVYDPTDEGGVAKLHDAGIALVSLPFFLKHEKDLGLRAKLQVVQKGRPALERWSLVAPKGKIKNGSALAGFTILSSAGFAPSFVRGVIAAQLGPVPAETEIKQSTAVLSSLRRAADGAPVAVLLDGPQAEAVASLAFADKLEVAARSPAFPAGIVAVVDGRVPDKTWSGLATALLGLASDHNGATALDGIQIAKFVALDAKALDAARTAYGSATK